MVERGADTFLIVNADDFGFSRGVNRGIAEAHENGIVTSASLMVKQNGAEDAARYASRRPTLDVGLHVDLDGEAARRRPWRRPRRAPVGTLEDVRRDMEAQLARFRQLLGTDPSHLDSHRHRHRYEPVRSLVLELAEGLGVPLREADRRIRFCGDFYGQRDGRPWPEGIHPGAEPPRIIARVVQTLVITKGMRRAPPHTAAPEPVVVSPTIEIAPKSRPDRDRTSAAPPSASPS